MKPKIAISMGDPGGIGPEVSLKAVATHRIRRECEPILIGDSRYLRHLAREMAIAVRLTGVGSRPARTGSSIAVVDAARILRRPPLGRPSRGAGRIAGRAVEKAVNLATSGDVEGFVTAPVSKESLALAGYGMVGHTELIARLTNTKAYAMMMVRGKLRVVFATTHLPVSAVARSLTRRTLLTKLKLTDRYLHLYMGIPQGRIGVTCLNPHCGEGGYLGREEETTIRPAIRLARNQGICVDGPYPADSIYRPDFASEFDAIVAMYHDQGMIPLKLRGHDGVVNITIGIPCVRTSPGHGTAFDIAGRRMASEGSMVRAILECARIAKRLRNAG